MVSSVEEFTIRLVDNVTVKGKSSACKIYEVRCPSSHYDGEGRECSRGGEEEVWTLRGGRGEEQSRGGKKEEDIERRRKRGKM